MLRNMKILTSGLQKAELERLHDTSRNEQVCDRIKATLLASEGWNSIMIVWALCLYRITVDHHIHEFMNKGKLKLENGDSDGKPSVEQISFLIRHLSSNLSHRTHEIITFALHTWGILFNVAGMSKWLHRNGFSYRKPTGTPHESSEERQAQFIEFMKT